MTAETLQNQADEISALLASKLRVRGRSLKAQNRKVGRRLPKKMRAHIAALLEAQEVIDHPKLGRQVDVGALTTGTARVVQYLEAIDPWERFKDRWLGILGAIAAALIATFILVVYVLWKRGLV